MRALLASFALLTACGSTAAPLDSASLDAGHDASPAPIDAAATDAGAMCAEGYAGCTTATAIDDTAMTSGIAIGTAGTGASGDNYRYATPCIRIRAGTTLSIANSALHPLRAASCSPSDTPITSATETSFTFAHAGRYGYWCENHGSDDGTPPGMAGLIIVE